MHSTSYNCLYYCIKHLFSVHIMSKSYKIVSLSCFLEKEKYISKYCRANKLLFCNKVLIWLGHRDQSKNWVICFSDASMWLEALIIIKKKVPIKGPDEGFIKVEKSCLIALLVTPKLIIWHKKNSLCTTNVILSSSLFQHLKVCIYFRSWK